MDQDKPQELTYEERRRQLIEDYRKDPNKINVIPFHDPNAETGDREAHLQELSTHLLTHDLSASFLEAKKTWYPEERQPDFISPGLEWFKGPALGGGGSAGMRDGVPWWVDGDILLCSFFAGEFPVQCELELYMVVADVGVCYLQTMGGDLADDDVDDIVWFAVVKNKHIPKLL